MLAMFAFREFFVKQGVRYNGIDYSSGVANMRPIAPRIRRPLLLRQWRKHRGLTQDKLAEMLGTTKGHISELETGKRPFA